MLLAETSYQESIADNELMEFRDWFLRYRERSMQDPRPSEGRRKQMHAVNPLYVLRNYLSQQAIDAAEEGDYSLLHELHEVLKTPIPIRKARNALRKNVPTGRLTKPAVPCCPAAPETTPSPKKGVPYGTPF